MEKSWARSRAAFARYKRIGESRLRFYEQEGLLPDFDSVSMDHYEAMLDMILSADAGGLSGQRIRRGVELAKSMGACEAREEDAMGKALDARLTALERAALDFVKLVGSLVKAGVTEPESTAIRERPDLWTAWGRYQSAVQGFIHLQGRHQRFQDATKVLLRGGVGGTDGGIEMLKCHGLDAGSDFGEPLAKQTSDPAPPDRVPWSGIQDALKTTGEELAKAIGIPWRQLTVKRDTPGGLTRVSVVDQLTLLRAWRNGRQPAGVVIESFGVFPDPSQVDWSGFDSACAARGLIRPSAVVERR